MKKGQMKISFGMIFSIILIIAFIAFGIYAILSFLEIQKATQIAQFREDLQNDVDKIWKATRGSQEFEGVLPSEIEEVCFENEDYANLFFYPVNIDFEDLKIEHIDIKKITENEKLCVEVKNGKVKMILSKDFGEELVFIEG